MEDIEQITDSLSRDLVQELCDAEGPVDINYKFYIWANDILCTMLHGQPLEDKDERDVVYNVCYFPLKVNLQSHRLYT